MQENKDLLLKDLCARLSYGVKININSCIEEQNQMRLFDVNLEKETIGVRNEKWAFRAIPIIDDEDETKVIKPYLRPMSSMTEEECITLSKLIPYETDAWKHIKTPIPLYIANIEQFDFFHRHHLDWRGLIPKGLALEAPKNMYNNE